MSRTLLTLLLSLALGLAALPAAAQPVVNERPLAPHVPGELLVRLAPTVTLATPSLAALLSEVGVQAVEPLFAPDASGAEQVYRLTLAPGRDEAAAIALLEASGLVAYAELNLLVAAAEYLPDDPHYGASGLISPGLSDLWGLHTIDMGAAWALGTGSPAVSVAVIDTGIDASHPELVGRLWENAGEIAANGLDDDGNGYIDDRTGWDFSGDDPLASDDNGHGTHVAGTIAATGDNGQGIAGIAWGVRVMALKTLDQHGFGSLELGARAIRYAADMGAQVINCSWGAATSSQLLAEAVAYAQSRGAIVVAAAGNSGGVYADFVPAALPGVIAVAATDPGDGRASFSNYGPAIDLAAPGRDILSLLAAGTEGRCARPAGAGYCLRSGTSMAAAHVSGVAALLRSRFPGWPPEAIAAQLSASAANIDAALGPYAGMLGAGRLDAGAALSPTQGGLSGSVHDEAGRPIVGAALQAGLFMAVADANGHYSFPPLPAGDYQLVVGAGGYARQQLALSITQGASLQRALILARAAPARLSGLVRETGRGWPLYAQLRAQALGDERAAFSDPVSGAFALELDAGKPYTLTITAIYPGYAPTAFALTPAAGANEQLVVLSADLASCAALGYRRYSEGCTAQDGALVIGAVRDAISGAGLPGALLSAGASGASAMATPGDPERPEGQYALFVPSGAATLAVAHAGYESLSMPAPSEPGLVVRRDLALQPHAHPSLVAASETLWGAPGASITHTLHLANLGSRPDRIALRLNQGPGCTGLPWRAALLGAQSELAAGGAAELTLRVSVPGAALYGASCAYSVEASSTSGGVVRATLNTRAGPGLESATAEGQPGALLERTLRLSGWAPGMADSPVTISVSGGRWPLNAPSTASLAELAREGLALRVGVPPAARAGERDSAVVRLLDGGGAELARAELTAVALPVFRPGLAALTPSVAAALPGRRASFTLRLSNSGNITDSYSLAASMQGQPVELPERLGPLAPGATRSFELGVQAPATATGRALLRVTARSAGDPSSAVDFVLTIDARPYAVMLPLVARP